MNQTLLPANSHSTRAGTFARQPNGYSAFIPKPLPPNPPIHIDSDMYALLSRADRSLGRLDGSIQTLPDPDLFVLMFARKEAVLSSRIEGTQSSLEDVLEAEAQVYGHQRRGDVHEIFNYVDAMNAGLSRLESLPVSTRLFREIHALLMPGARGGTRQPGEFRATQNWIGPSGCTLHEAIFVPPPPAQVEPAIGDLERFLHDKSDDLPALIRIGLAHAQFETIHPFLDGNGRMGRLLITFLLCEKKILIRPVLYLSHYFRQHQQAYYDLLQGIRETGDWEAWLKFFLKGVAQVSNEATETARRIVELRERHRALITEQFGMAAANGLRILEYLYRSPVVTVGQLAEKLQVSHTGANNLVRRFENIGLLHNILGRQRSRWFRYGEYIGLFSGD